MGEEGESGFGFKKYLKHTLLPELAKIHIALGVMGVNANIREILGEVVTLVELHEIGLVFEPVGGRQGAYDIRLINSQINFRLEVRTSQLFGEGDDSFYRWRMPEDDDCDILICIGMPSDDLLVNEFYVFSDTEFETTGNATRYWRKTKPRRRRILPNPESNLNKILDIIGESTN